MEWLLAAAWDFVVDHSWIVLATAVAIIAFFLEIWSSSTWSVARETDPRVAALHRLLETMDRRLSKKWKLHRNPGETLHQFAARIREMPIDERMSRDESKAAKIVQLRRTVAHWYERYASVRYATRVDDPGVAALKALL
jgi:hypothetical protein